MSPYHAGPQLSSDFSLDTKIDKISALHHDVGFKIVVANCHVQLFLKDGSHGIAKQLRRSPRKYALIAALRTIFSNNGHKLPNSYVTVILGRFVFSISSPFIQQKS